MSGWKIGAALCSAVAAVLLGAGLSNKSLLAQWSPASSPREELVVAAGAVRPSEGRITGGFSHAPVGKADRAEVSDELLRAKKKIERSAEGGSPDGVADLAILRLLDGRAGESVLLLEGAVQSAPGDARLWSDLSASYYARGKMRGQPWDVILGLAAAEEALALAPDLPEALFNRALGLEKVHLVSKAQESWIAARDAESDPAWGSEIQGRISAARQPSETELWHRSRSRLRAAALKGDQAAVESITGRFREAARVWVEEELLPSWAEAQAGRRDAEASRDLAVARAVGEALARGGGDTVAQDAVAVIVQAREKQRRHLVEGHRAYGRALRLYPGDVRGALAGMRDANISLTQGRSPFAAWAEFWTALCAYQLSSHPEAVATLEALQHSPVVATHAALRGRVEWMVGLVAFNKADLFGAVRAYSQALTVFEELGEPQNLASVQCRLSLVLAALGDADRAWRLQERALAALHRFRDPWRISALLEVAAYQLLRSGQPRVALAFQDEFVRLAIDQADPVTASAALQQRAETLLAVDRMDDAREDLQQAREWVEQISDIAVREVTRGDLAFREGVVLTRIDPAHAVEFLDEALRSYLRSEYRVLVVQLYLQRAIAQLRIGQAEGAEADLTSGLAELERVRSGIESRKLRASYFELARPAFEEMVLYQVGRGRCGPAFDIWERSRARTLLEAAEREEAEGPATVKSVRSALDPTTGLVEYASLEDELVVWLLRRDGVHCKRASMSARTLASLVREYRNSLIDNSEGSGKAAVRLHAAILGPVEAEIAGLSSLVVVPDRELYRVPFAALQDGRSGRYLVESSTVTMAHSAGLWLRSQLRSESFRPPVSVVTLGDPAFERESFPSLSRLAGAAEEARDIAAVYPVRELWLGVDATKSRLLHGLSSADVVHVAAHALPGSAEAPPYLLLSPEPGVWGGGALSLDTLENLAALQAQVVILSACGTGAGPLSSMEGAMSLARPFIEAGVPGVVVSLWSVEDRASRDFLVDFHRGLRKNQGAVVALRQAQLRALSSPEPSARSPKNWAAFVVVGADSSDGLNQFH